MGQNWSFCAHVTQLPYIDLEQPKHIYVGSKLSGAIADLV